ncbi:MAG: hypothetical protein KBD05_03595 [Candidatus Pacebacteria bacterium]|nr:hypothetical protein [Candidatus Paceibacterota bacterium]
MKKPLIHLVIALVLLAAAGTAYVFWYARVTALELEVAELATRAEQADKAAADIVSARSALSKLVADEAYFGSYFVSTSTVVSYLENLESTGDELGSVVEVVSVTPAGSTRLSISFRATGSFASVMRTLGAIEFGPYDASMMNLTLDTNASSEGKWMAAGVVSVGMNPVGVVAPPAPTAPPVEEELDV